jgi:hypothetical protein
MIPFFRKIRKKMADDNRPLKYTRYAIGEIVLVVIGILIALQINTWNEEQKRRVEERDLLLVLKRELDLNLKELNKYHKNGEEVLKKVALYWTYFEKEKSAPSKDSIADFVINIAWTEAYRPEFNTLSSVISTSRISLIKNEELRYYINRLSTASKALIDFDQQRVTLRNEKVIPELSQYFYIGRAFNYLMNSSQGEEKLYNDGIGDFFSKIEYNNLIGQYFGFVNSGFSTSGWVIDILKDTQAIIDEELQKYDDIATKSFYSKINLEGTAVGDNDTIVSLKSENKENTLWKGTAKLKQGEVSFINRNSYAIIWSGKTFPKGEITEIGSLIDGSIPVTKGTYTILLDLKNNTYEFIKQDD